MLPIYPDFCFTASLHNGVILHIYDLLPHRIAIVPTHFTILLLLLSTSPTSKTSFRTNSLPLTTCISPKSYLKGFSCHQSPK